MDSWQKHHFEVLQTQDGSPSLRWMGSPTTESMHHSGGAFSETKEIYGKPLKLAFKYLSFNPIEVCSVGLGLGYNELMSVEVCLNSSRPILLTSYESNDFLKESFLHFLRSGDPTKPQHNIYSTILNFYQRPEHLRSTLLKMLEQNHFTIEGALSLTSAFSKKFNVVLFDAFSQKTSPELWSEDFLRAFFSKACSDTCVFSTYACTGVLKRALRAEGFNVVVRPGFYSKRDSTVAYRGISDLAGAGVDEFLNILNDGAL